MIRLAAELVGAWWRFAGALRRDWRRILAGAVAGWAIASVAGAVALAWQAESISPASSNMLGAVIVWAGVGIGALAGYAWPREREELER